MKSLRNIAGYPASRTLAADEITEFHAARLLLLLKICGTAKKVDGLTKLAKLDFFVRYPDFFNRVCALLDREGTKYSTVDSAMVRHHYGPWDYRYYQVLAYLQAKNLITVERGKKNNYVFELTQAGDSITTELAASPAFADIINHMAEVKKVFGKQSGNKIKALIYDVFRDEVTSKNLGDIIK